MKYIPLWAKLLIYFSIVITFLGYIGIGAFTYWAIKTSIDNQHTLDTAIDDIKLPPEYKLADTTYDSETCIDSLCATLHYKSNDGSPLDEDTVYDELDRLGYGQGDEYTKTYDGKKIYADVDQFTDTPEELTINMSL